MLQKTLKHGEAGFSLVETMIAAMVFSVLIGLVTVFIKDSNSQLVFNTMKMEQARMIQAIRADLRNMSKIRDMAMLAASGPELILKKCLTRNSSRTNDCSGPTVASKQIAFNFSSRLGPGSPFVKKGGTPAAPANYSMMGQPNCTVGTTYCPFWKVETYFWVTCPKGATECDQATSLHLRFIVKPARTSFQDKKLKSTPPQADFDAQKSKFAITHVVSDSQYKIDPEQDCPTGAIMNGLKDSGVINCVCRGGFINRETNPNRPPRCESLGTCPAGHRLKGRRGDGSPVCVAQRVVCRTVEFADEQATCPVGGWLENVNLGVCRAAKANKKGTDRGITCDHNEGKCCFYEES